MDPYAVLGLAPDASQDDAASAWRRLAKRHHPDHGGGDAAQRRMAEINAAYDLIRTGQVRPDPVGPSGPAAPGRQRRSRGSWLEDATRSALGPELVGALEPMEPVHLVTPASTWASPQTLLAVTDRRLLWLLDDAISHRVRSVGFGQVERVEDRLSWPRRRTARVVVHTAQGRKLTFSELSPALAEIVVRHVRTAM